MFSAQTRIRFSLILFCQTVTFSLRIFQRCDEKGESLKGLSEHCWHTFHRFYIHNQLCNLLRKCSTYFSLTSHTDLVTMAAIATSSTSSTLTKSGTAVSSRPAVPVTRVAIRDGKTIAINGEFVFSCFIYFRMQFLAVLVPFSSSHRLSLSGLLMKYVRSF